MITTLGVDNLVIVETPDAILVADKSRAQDVGKVVARLAPPEDEATRQRSAQDAVARLQQASRGVSLGRLKSRDLIREGRR